MHKFLSVAAALALVAGVAVAAELKSGPAVGAKVPGAFEPFNVNGPDAGYEVCLYCKYGSDPVAMVFAQKPTDGLTALIKKLEEAGAKHKDADFAACVVFTGTDAALKSDVKKLADKENFKHVTLAVVDPAKVKSYELSQEAEATVLLYKDRTIKANHAFKAGELNEKAAGGVVADLPKILPVK
jgi:hypothetical protein